MTVLGLMMTAYGVFADGLTASPGIPEIAGGPDWIASDTYDVTAEAERAAPISQMAGPMLRALLEDRFRLRIHREEKEVPVYFLNVARDGPKLEATKEGSCVPIDPDRPPQNLPPGQPPRNYCRPVFQLNGTTATITSHGGTLKQFTEALLTRMVGRPVIDRTGLAGQYDFQIQFEYTPGGLAAGNGGANDSSATQPLAVSNAPSIFEALNKLGLKLEPGKGPKEVIIIDHVERPTEN
jgi:uncharacterized protein (TIGR03435 family)